MFFYLSKIFWIIAAPLSFLWLLVGAGFVLKYFKIRLGNKILIFCGILFLILGFFPIGYNMMVFLETCYERPQPMPAKVDGIIVLGGAFNTGLSKQKGTIVANSNINRMIDFVDLSRQYPTAKLIFSGGSGDIYNLDSEEAGVAESFMKMLNIDTSNIIFEGKSRNSFENAKFSKELAQPKAGEIWILITSGYHMPRSMGVFEKQAWDIIPYPSSPKTDGNYRLLPKPFDVLSNFYMLGTAVKEFIGCIIYYFSGKSAFLLPVSRLDSPESVTQTE